MQNKLHWLTAPVVVLLLIASIGCSSEEAAPEVSQAIVAPPAGVQPSPQVAPQMAQDALELAVQESPQQTAQDAPDDGGNPPAAGTGISLQDVLALWSSGQRTEAIENFVAVTWQDESAGGQIRGLNMSEADLSALPPAERNAILRETISMSGPLRELMTGVAAEAARVAAAGDVAKGKQHLGAIRQYGDYLAGPGHIQILQLQGQAATGFADQKLAEFP